MNTTPLLPNFFAGRWQTGADNGTTLFDPVLGTPLVRVSNTGLDLKTGKCLKCGLKISGHWT